MKFKAFAIIPRKDEIEIKPIVLCKECRWWDKDEYCDMLKIRQTESDWFCAHGEKVGMDG